ncbi:unnamed protein product [Amaranthus hypochondriacus]
MSIASSKDYAFTSNLPRALSSIITSVGLLVVFVTLASWVLLSYPIGTVVRSYFYGVDQTNLPNVEGTTEVGLNQNLKDSQKQNFPVSFANSIMPKDEAIENPKLTEDRRSTKTDLKNATYAGLPKPETTGNRMSYPHSCCDNTRC